MSFLFWERFFSYGISVSAYRLQYTVRLRLTLNGYLTRLLTTNATIHTLIVAHLCVVSTVTTKDASRRVSTSHELNIRSAQREKTGHQRPANDR